MHCVHRSPSFIEDEAFMAKNKYCISRKLGEGTYAIVRRGRHEVTQTLVAVKIVDRRKAPKDFREKFLPRELEILKAVSHPNIAKMYDIFDNEHKVYIVMEHAGHGDLLDYIRLRGTLPEPMVKVMFLQLCHAVQYLHSQKIAHRDLKCENLLLDMDNNIKVTDFGFARFFGNMTDLCSTFCGSMAYAAPEVVQGIKYYAPHHDVWAVGVILFIMMFAEMPFDDSDPIRMLKEQMKGVVRFPHGAATFPQARDLIQCILVVNVSLRYSLQQIIHHPWLKTEATSKKSGSVSLLTDFGESSGRTLQEAFPEQAHRTVENTSLGPQKLERKDVDGNVLVPPEIKAPEEAFRGTRSCGPDIPLNRAGVHRIAKRASGSGKKSHDEVTARDHGVEDHDHHGAVQELGVHSAGLQADTEGAGGSGSRSPSIYHGPVDTDEVIIARL